VNAPVAGIDVGGSNIRVAVGDPDAPETLRHRRLATPADHPAFAGHLADLVEDACHEAGLDPRRLAAIGVGLPGTVADGVATFVPALPALDGAAIGPDLEARLHAPVRVANDAQCALLAERRLGAAVGRRHVALVVVGTGVGGALLVDGRLYPGGRGAAGAFGWLPADAEPDRRHGAWERAASGRALTERAGRLGLAPGELMTRAARGDRPSRDALESYAYALGRGLAAIASAWDPELLVLGGVISPHFAMLSAGIARAFDDWASPAGRRVPRVAAQLGPDAGVLGALCLADEQTRRP
jgi:glucokinase